MAYTREQFQQFAETELAEPRSDLTGLALGVGLPAAAIAAGFARTRSGERVWSHYYKFFRRMEGALPMGIGATFRPTEIISPLAAPRVFSLRPEEHAELFKAAGWRDYLSRVTGKRVGELEQLGAFGKGIEWEKTGNTLGTLRIAGGGPTLADNIGALSTGPRRTGGILEYFARVLGSKKSEFFRGLSEVGDDLRPAWMPIGAGGGSPLKLAGQFGYSLFSSAMGRMNLLLQSPFDLEVMEEAAKRVPLLGRIKLGVKPGTGLQMLGRYAGKGAVILGAYHGLKYADYLAREYGPIGGVPAGAAVGAAAGLAFGLKAGMPKRYAAVGAVAGAALGMFGLGPMSGAAAAYSSGRVTQAQVSKTTGLGEGARRTEDFFPGLTKPTTLVAAAGIGLLLGGIREWGQRLKLARAVGRPKGQPISAEPARDVYEYVEAAVSKRREKLHKLHAGRAAKQTGALKFLSEIKARWHGGYRGKTFKPAGAGRYAALGAAAFMALSAGGSLLAEDYAGAGLMAGAGAAAAVAYGKKGGVAAALALALPFLLREKEDPEKLKRIYAGEEKVPIKAGRWWELGRTPYEGGRPYFRPHRVAMLRSGAHEAALYGSEKAYWKTDPLLHPLRFLASPYEREKLMWEQGYKFPVSKTPFEDFPVIGPVLAATIGRAIKPARLLGKEEWIPEREEPAPEGWAELPRPEPIMRTGVKGTIGEQAYRLTELAGLPGFAFQSIKERITGNESFFPEDQYATPSIVSGIEPAWWSSEMGGMALLSEGIRRYIPHRRTDVEYRNPLPSDLPSWLPGADSGYFLDFSSAEVYSKIKEPWARLPGAGLAALNPELKGVAPEEYPAHWRFKVLADLAPWSKEYGEYNKLMSQMQSEGRLTTDQLLDIQRVRNQVTQTKRAKEFQQYRYDSEAIEKVRVGITSEVEPGVYLTDTFGSAPISLAGIDTSRASLANIAMREEASLTAERAMEVANRKRGQISDYLREHIYPGAEIDVYVHRDPSALMERGPSGMPEVKAIASVGGQNLNRALVEEGLAESMAAGEALDPMMATSGVQRSFGRFWENLAHGAETPLESFSPLAPVSKFVHQRTALEEYQRSEVYGRNVALWQKPIAHFLAPGFSTTAFWAGWKGLPREVRERYMVEEYFDRLEYMKWKRAESTYRAKGEGDLAARYASRAARTMTGVDKFSPMSARLALPAKERAYFKEFVETPTAAERREISRIVSPQMGEILHAQWARRASEASQMRVEAGIGNRIDLQSGTRFDAIRDPQGELNRRADTQQAMEEMPVPGPAWVGWDPNADVEDYKVKTIMDRDMDLSGFGLWDSDVRRAERRPWTTPISASFEEDGGEVLSSTAIRRRFNRVMMRQGSRPPSVSATGSGHRRFNIDVPGYDRLDRYMRDPSIMQF